MLAASHQTHIAPAAGKNEVGNVTKRLQTELRTLMTSPASGVTAFPEGDNFFSWRATIKGVAGTPYEGMQFRLSLKFPPTYPYTAPVVRFETACFHPNVDQHGNICLDILKDKWSAVSNVQTVLLSVQALLGEPNVDSPLNAYAAQLWPNSAEYARVLKQSYATATAGTGAPAAP